MDAFETVDSVKAKEGVVQLKKVLLTDGSFVYDIYFYDESGKVVFTLCPANKKEAYALFDAIGNAV